MKTITEFTSIHIKNAAKLKADLVASGKTPEELAPAIGETLKLEGDKLTHLLNAVETVGDRHGDLKRVIVYAPLNETEKAPSGAQKHGESYYFAEYYASLQPKKQDDKHAGGRDGKRGGRGGRDKKGGRDDKRGPRRDRGPRAADAAQQGPVSLPKPNPV